MHRRKSTLCPRLPLAFALAIAYPAAGSAAEPDAETVQTVVIAGEKETDGYTADAVSIGKGQRTLRETPQSVSVVTSRRIEDQNLRSLADALQATTGITIEQANSHEQTFHSRGFQVDTIQYDGVPTQRGNGFAIGPDLSVYEQVEVLRGPAGLYNGAGSPGGTVNLVRKRPLKANALQGMASAGRWDHYRGQVDASFVLNDAGTLRTRVVAAHEDRDHFYDVARSKRTVGYAIVEADVGRETTLGAGVQYERNDMVPFYGGVPRFSDGRDLNLPRSTYLNAAWSKTDIASTTVFADLHHRFGNGWKLRVAGSRMREDNDDLSGSVFGTVDVATNAGPRLSSFRQHLLGEQSAADATLEGGFDALGRRHDVIVGANWMQRDYDLASQALTVQNAAVDPFTFDPRAYAVAPTVPARPAAHTLADVEQSGLYASVRLAVADQVKLVLGGRTSRWATNTRNLVTGLYSIAPYKERGEFTPYGALSFDFAPEWTTYLSYAAIFRSQANQVTASGDRLDPATGKNIEAGIKGALYGGRLNASAALFRIVEDNRSQTDPLHPTPCAASPTGGACFVAEGRVRSQGLDAEVSGALLPGLDLTAGYTYNQTRYLRDRTATGLPSANENQPLSTFTPRHIARLWANWDPAGSPWSAGGGVNAQSKTYKTGGALRFEQGSYAIWSARAGYRINRNLTASVNLNNLFDKTYYRTLGSTSGSNWYGEPRNVTATLRATF